jgi:hypothetical protein
MRFYAVTAAWCALGVMLAAAYVMPFYFDFMLESSARSVQDYAWADMFRDTVAGSVSNFFLPLRADVNGAFGATGLWVLAALAVPGAALCGVRVPAVVWVVLALAVGVFAVTQGARTPLHRLAWEWLPLASSFRVAGRFAIAMPWLFMVLLAWWMHVCRVQGPGAVGLRRLPGIGAALMVLGAAVLVLWGPPPTEYAPLSLRTVPPWVEVLSTTLGVAILAWLALGRLAGASAAAWCLLTVAQIALVSSFGTWHEAASATPTRSDIREAREALEYRRATGAGLYSDAVVELLQRSHLQPELARLYRESIATPDREGAFAELAAGRGRDAAIVEAPEAPLATPSPWSGDSVRVTFAQFNRVSFEVEAADRRLMVVNFPHSRNWRVRVDDLPVPTLVANGGHVGFAVPAGSSSVDLRYESAASRYGMKVSGVAIAALFAFAGMHSRVGRRGLILSCALGAALAILLYSGWSASLYGGANLGARYRWDAPRTERPTSLAFGKPTAMSSQYVHARPEWFNAGRGADGSRTPNSGFMTDAEKRPLWSVDLGRIRAVSRVRLFESRIEATVNRRPLSVAVSDDRVRWTVAATLTREPVVGARGTARTELRLEPPARGRFVAVMAAWETPGHLSFDEVEVFGPQ